MWLPPIRLKCEMNELAEHPLTRSAPSAMASACPKSTVRMQSKAVLCSDVTRRPCTVTGSSPSTICQRMLPDRGLRFARDVATQTESSLLYETGKPNTTAADSWQNVQVGCWLCNVRKMQRVCWGSRNRVPVRGACVHAPCRPDDFPAFDSASKRFAKALVRGSQAHSSMFGLLKKPNQFGVIGFHLRITAI